MRERTKINCFCMKMCVLKMKKGRGHGVICENMLFAELCVSKVMDLKGQGGKNTHCRFQEYGGMYIFLNTDAMSPPATLIFFSSFFGASYFFRAKKARTV